MRDAVRHGVVVGVLVGLLACGSAVAAPPPAAIDDLRRHAAERYAARDYLRAVETYRHLLALGDAGRETGRGLVRSLLALVRLDDALEAAATLERSAPAAAWPRTLLGEVHWRRGELGEARVAFSTALEHGESARAHLGLGRLAQSSFDRRSAAQHFRRARALDPTDPEIEMEWLGTLDDFEAAIRATEAWLRHADDLDSESRRIAQAHLAFKREIGDRELFVRASSADRYRIPLRRGRGLIVQASINGAEPVDLLLDTGAKGVFLTPRAAWAARVRKLQKVPVRGLGDGEAREGHYGWAESIRLGELTLADCPVHVLHGRVPLRADGVLGVGVLASFLIRLDYAGAILELDPLPARDDVEDATDWAALDRPEVLPAGFVPLHTWAGDLLLPARVNGLAEGLLVVDSGAVHDMLSRRLARRVGRPSPSPYSAGGFSGAVDGLGELHGIVLDLAGQVQVQDWSVLVLDLDRLSQRVGLEISGLIGDPLLGGHAVTLNYRDGCVRFDGVDGPPQSPRDGSATGASVDVPRQ